MATTTIRPYYVVDTNALLWYLTGSKRLSGQARAIFEAAERGETRLIVSAIVVAELFYADKKSRLFKDFAQTYRQMKTKIVFSLHTANR